MGSWTNLRENLNRFKQIQVDSESESESYLEGIRWEKPIRDTNTSQILPYLSAPSRQGGIHVGAKKK